MDRRIIEQIARMARLEIEESLLARFEGQLTAVLAHFEILAELERIDPHETSAEDSAAPAPRLREDAPRKKELDATALLDAAPEREGPMFRVPRVLP